MLRIEFIPLNKGNRFLLDKTTPIIIGRTPSTGCLDNKVSRNHAKLFMKSDSTLWIKSIHHNPTFYKTKTNQIVTLTKDKEYQLYDNDQFGLLPDEYFYRVSIQTKAKELEKTLNTDPIITNTATVPKSPIIDHPSTSTDTKVQNNDTANTISTVIEPTNQTATSNNVNISTANSTPPTSTTTKKRERCIYGESCYRKNLIHRQQVSHPGDTDWERDENETNETRPKKRVLTLQNEHRTRKRKTSEIDDDDDDDGLPNEYDYNDSFIDDSNSASSSEESSGSHYSPDESSEESDFDLTRQEADEFVESSTTRKNHGTINKRPRLDDEDDN